MEEEKLRQLFKNRSNCYADSDDVIQAMDEDCFIETIKEALSQHDVIGQSDSLIKLIDFASSVCPDDRCRELADIIERI